MTGWILFVGLLCFIFGMVAGWFLCIFAIAHYVANDIIKKETKKEEEKNDIGN